MDTHPEAPTIGYAEFGDWYTGYRAAVLEPALAVATSGFDRLLREQLSERDLTRIRSQRARVKSKRRLWRKLHHARYEGRVSSAEDIPSVIDDLIGLRVTCVNLRDHEMVQAALDGLPRHPTDAGELWVEGGSERDYVLDPKESGYRGWHVNLGISVVHDGVLAPLHCELQVRTVLQDSWGELTHEDTYSKDGSLPPLVEILSKRMADLLATLDDIAEDLRTELDRIDAAAVADPGDGDPDTAVGADDEDLGALAADAATMLADHWQALDRPIHLAALAWELQREFGAEISDGWFGHRSFKRFLRHAVPDGEISTGRQAYLLPPDDGTDWDPPGDVEPGPGDNGAASGHIGEAAAPGDGAGPGASANDDEIPGAARQMRRIDRGLPLLTPDAWARLFEQLAIAWRRVGSKGAPADAAARLARSTQDRSTAAGRPVSERHARYVADAVLSADAPAYPRVGGRAPHAPDADELADRFTAVLVQRMEELRVLGPESHRARAALAAWLGGVRGAP